MTEAERGRTDLQRRRVTALRSELVRRAGEYPHVVEAYPWGERVAKVNGKIFVFFGGDEADEFFISLKLPESAEHALSIPGNKATGYGLGKAHWVTIRLDRHEGEAEELLFEWLEESYRAIAPRRISALIAEEDPESTKPEP
jgi:predicted DNA-binding protein (MmcQ/YjbR family)